MPVDDDSAATNLAGSIIFWSYIVAALAATARALVYISHDAVIAPSSPAISRARRVFSFLALCSFTCLSYHMMNVLILSYIQWSVARHLRLPTCLIGDGCLLGKAGPALDLWHWSTTSTLFQDFGAALVLNNARWAWSSAALALTFVNVAYMCIAGRHLQSSRIWTCMVIAEILPISFAQCLFYLMLLSGPGTTGPSIQSSRAVIFVSATGYTTMLVMAHAFGKYLIEIILCARVFLIAPLLLSGSTSQAESLASDVPLLVLVMLAVAGTVPAGYSIYESGLEHSLAAINSHPAVSALGYDLLISCAAWLAWLAYRPGDLAKAKTY